MKRCPVCNTEIIGRQDKIYCSVQCKSADYYESKTLKQEFYFRVDRQLKTNRKLLKRYNQKGLTTLRKEILLAEGFNPRFFTHYWKNSKKQTYLFCYEYGFTEFSRDGISKYNLVHWQNYMEKIWEKS